VTSKRARAAALRTEVARLSFIHHTSAGYEADQRAGAKLVDEAGRVLAERVSAPTRGAASRVITPWRPDPST
jgi:hypothetical protein